MTDTTSPPSIWDSDPFASARLDEEALELLSARNETEPEVVDGIVTNPFDPSKIRITTKAISLDNILERMKQGEINMSPDFQRKAGIWDDGQQSRLIESLLIRIPLPAFYMDATDDDYWLVVDGLQRLTTFRRFILSGELRLRGMEFLIDLNGLAFKEMPRNFQRRILETQVTVYLIDPGTPPEVKFNIFRRINTGGLPLSAQEIRHALNQGQATILLQEMAEDPLFKQAIDNGISNDRMADRECILRFFAFLMTPPECYAANDLDSFLNDAMKTLNHMSPEELDRYKNRFLRAMSNVIAVFGTSAFRKYHPTRRMPINKALFEAWAVALEALSNDQIQCIKNNELHFYVLWMNLSEHPVFNSAISSGTGDVVRIKLRFAGVRQIIQETLDAANSKTA